MGSLTIVQTWYRDVSFRALLLLSYRVAPDGSSLHSGHAFRLSKFFSLFHKLKKRREKLDKRVKPCKIYANMVSDHGWADAPGDTVAVKLQDLQQPKAEPGLVCNRKV